MRKENTFITNTDRLQIRRGLENRWSNPLGQSGFLSAGFPLEEFSKGKPFVGHKIISAEEVARIKRLKKLAKPR